MKIQILMSTYNGSRYIRTQLDSIVAQNVANKELLIRDDGSADDTTAIIEEYHERYSWIRYYKGENIGVQKSFFELIEKADSSADYIAFADQDDEWLPDKLKKAVEVFEGRDRRIPLLYCSNRTITDANLQSAHVTVTNTVKKTGFGNSLVQNICTGCTAVINQSMIRILKENVPQNIDKVIMHDWWLYLTAACFGEVYYDQNSYIRYRQHGSNTFGAIVRRKDLLDYRIKQLFQPRGEIYRQNEEFLETYRRMLKKQNYREEYYLLVQILKAEKGLYDRIKVVFNRKYFRQKAGDDLVFRGILIIGKL